MSMGAPFSVVFELSTMTVILQNILVSTIAGVLVANPAKRTQISGKSVGTWCGVFYLFIYSKLVLLFLNVIIKKTSKLNIST